MKVIPQTRHSHYISYLRFYFYFTMSVPDEGYSTNTSFALHYISSVSIFILLWAYLMKVIPQNTSFALRTWWRVFHKSSFLFLFYYERTWWRLFHKHIIRTTLAIFVSIFILLWAYLEGYPQTVRVYERNLHEGYSTLAISSSIFIFYERTWNITNTSFALHYLRFYFYFTMSVPDEGYSTNTSFAQVH